MKKNHNSSIVLRMRGFLLHSKVVGSNPVAFICFFFPFNLLVCSSLFLILCRLGCIYLNLAYVYSINAHVET